VVLEDPRRQRPKLVSRTDMLFSVFFCRSHETRKPHFPSIKDQLPLLAFNHKAGALAPIRPPTNAVNWRRLAQNLDGGIVANSGKIPTCWPFGAISPPIHDLDGISHPREHPRFGVTYRPQTIAAPLLRFSEVFLKSEVKTA